MIIFLSPAKTLDFSHPGPSELRSVPEFGDEAVVLANILRKLTAYDLQKLMSISVKLAHQNYDRYQQWALADKLPEAKQAVFAYKGDAYNGLRAHEFSDAELTWAQEHLRILSGLYGILRPLDLIMPYRLEFATKLEVKKYKSLYGYWKDHLERSLDSLVHSEGSGILINLASAEYYKAININKNSLKVITPVFKEYRNGEYRFFSMFGKKARGMMARYIISKSIEDPEEIKLFNDEGYLFTASLSDEKTWVFTR